MQHFKHEDYRKTWFNGMTKVIVDVAKQEQEVKKKNLNVTDYLLMLMCLFEYVSISVITFHSQGPVWQTLHVI